MTNMLIGKLNTSYSFISHKKCDFFQLQAFISVHCHVLVLNIDKYQITTSNEINTSCKLLKFDAFRINNGHYNHINTVNFINLSQTYERLLRHCHSNKV